MKVSASRQRTVQLTEQLIAEEYDEERVTLRYFPQNTGKSETITLSVELLDKFCVAWFKSREPQDVHRHPDKT